MYQTSIYASRDQNFKGMTRAALLEGRHIKSRGLHLGVVPKSRMQEEIRFSYGGYERFCF